MAIHFRRNQIKTNDLTRQSLDGRDYVVVPTTIIVAGVLNGGLIPSGELETFAERWNGRPIPLRHPQNETGEYISASSPEVIEQSVMGTFFNATFKDDRVVGEMWLDVAKINQLGGDALSALQRIEAGEILEVSTGYFSEYIEDKSGNVNGKAYSEVQHALVPDHIALLPDEVGACSIADGCGANRTNAVQKDYSNSVMVAFYLRPEDAKALSDLWTDRKTAVPTSEMHVTLAYLGEKDSLVTTYEQLSRLLAEFAALQTVILAEVGGWVRFSGSEKEDAVALLVDSDSLSVFRRWLADAVEWQLDQPVSRPDQYIPHVATAYVKKKDEISLPTVERIPLAFTQLALSWGDQTVVFDMRGEMRDVSESLEVARQRVEVNMANAAKTPCEKEAVVIITNTTEGVDTGASKVPVIPATEVVVETHQALPAEVDELVTLVSELGGIKALKATLATITANAAAERDRLVSAIKANKALQFSDADFSVMSVEGLRSLVASMGRGANADYSGRAGAVVNSNLDDGQYEDYVAPKAK